MEVTEAKQLVVEQTRDIGGSLNWYSTDYWSELLEIDVIEIRSRPSLIPAWTGWKRARR